MNRLQIRHFSKLGGNLMRREAVDGPQPLKNDAESKNYFCCFYFSYRKYVNFCSEKKRNDANNLNLMAR